MNPDFTFGPDRAISLGASGDGEYRIIVTRQPGAGVAVHLDLSGVDEHSDNLAETPAHEDHGQLPPEYQRRIDTVVGHRCGRPTRRGTRCQTRVAEQGLACCRHRYF